MSFLEEALERVGVVGVIFLVIALYLLKWIFDLVIDPLRDIPGPFLARFTRLWLLRQYVNGDFQKTNLELHEQYGMFSIFPGPECSCYEQLLNFISRSYHTHRSKSI